MKDTWVKRELDYFKDIYGIPEDDEVIAEIEKACEILDKYDYMGEVADIVSQLISKRPLTSIHDIEDEWKDITKDPEAGIRYYTNTRLNGLIKKINTDTNEVFYYDNSKIKIRNLVNPLVSNVQIQPAVDFCNKKFPITMPYEINDLIYVVDCEGYLYNEIDDYISYMNNGKNFPITNPYDERLIMIPDTVRICNVHLGKINWLLDHIGYNIPYEVYRNRVLASTAAYYKSEKGKWISITKDEFMTRRHKYMEVLRKHNILENSPKIGDRFIFEIGEKYGYRTRQKYYGI